MRKRIWRLSEDKFDNQRPKVSFSSEELHIVGEEGTKLQEDFILYSANEVPLKGIVYSSNPYVRLLKPQFQGTEARIRFEILGSNYMRGDQLLGYFTVVCNQGEYRLPFHIEFCGKKLAWGDRSIASLEDFAALARERWQEAMQLFYSSAFAEFMLSQSIDLQLLYQGFKKALPSSVNLEEFLVAAGLKEPVVWSVEERLDSYYGVWENRKETIEITKSTWGYLELAITCDRDFVTMEKAFINSDYFLGSTMELNYYIHTDRMHAGKNYARITISGKGMERIVSVMATAEKENYHRIWKYRQKKQWLAKITELYEEYRFCRITTGDWCAATVDILDRMICKKNIPWYHLMKAQCYIMNKQRQEALWIISDMKKEITDRSGAMWAYLLYLCTLLEQETDYVNRLTKEIETIFRKHPEDVRIFWCLSFLREEYYQNSSRRLKAIFQWMKAGYHSPFLYIEAYVLYLQDPYLLRGFTPEAVKILLWAARKQIFSRDLAMQVAHVLQDAGAFDMRIWRIAQAAFAIYPEKDFLAEIVSYLLRNNQYAPSFLPWYRRGIEEELHLNGIYEAYMMTLPAYSPEALPQMLLLYFQYNCSLPYQKKALLYANVIANRSRTPRLYLQYLSQIEPFALEQMALGHIDDNLAMVYQNILVTGILSEELARIAAGMVFMRKIVTLHPDVTRVFLYQEQYEMPLVVPMVQFQAYIPIVSRHYRLFLETTRGEMLCDASLYAMQRMLYPEPYFLRLNQLAPCALPFVLFDFDRKKDAGDYQLSDLPKIEVVIQSSLVSQRYVSSLYPVFVTFLQEHCREELLEQHFLDEVDAKQLDSRVRSFMIELFISRGHYVRAYDMMRKFMGLEVDARLLMELVNEQISVTEFAEDPFLLSLAGYLLELKKTTPLSISYLSQYYVGPTGQMLMLWKESKELKLMVPELEENILFQSLYTENLVEKMQPVYDSYMVRGRDKMLMEAYLNYWSHEYMLGNTDVPEELFTYLAYYFDREIPLKESGRLAYLKYLSTLPLLSEREFKLQDELLNTYIRRNIYFGFYSHMEQKLIIKYQLYDKQFVEYRGNPGERILISYRLGDGTMHREEMVEMYEGIFVRQFVLFYGETITYEIFGESLPEDTPAAAGQLSLPEPVEEGHEDRFDLLNRMQKEMTKQQKALLMSHMETYQRLKVLSESLFTTV